MTNLDALLGPDLAAETASLDPAPYCVFAVRGPDAKDFLQRLCSQDVAGIGAGEARPAAFLNAKGKLESLAWIGQLDGDYWVEAQAHEGAKLAALLDRYHFTEKLAIEQPAGWASRMVFGPGACSDELAAGALQRAGAALCFTGSRAGLRWSRWHGPVGSLPGTDVPSADESAFHLRRIAAGLPWMGRDVDDKTLGMEAGIEDHIATTKGCYTGQEIVARIHTYGHVNRTLCRLAIEGSGPVTAGSTLLDGEGVAVGRVFSVEPLPRGGRLGLGLLPRELAGSDARLRLAADGSVVRIVT